MRGQITSVAAERANPETLYEGIFLKHALLSLRPQVPTDEAFLDILLKDECGDSFDRLEPPRDLLDQLIKSQRSGETDRIAKRYRRNEPLLILKSGRPDRAADACA